MAAGRVVARQRPAGGPRGRRLQAVPARGPEAEWPLIAPRAVHDTNSYAEWTRTQPGVSRHTGEADAEVVRQCGDYLVLTPGQCRERAVAGYGMHLKPLLGGLDPDVAASTIAS
jgi:hypothetical protein